MLLMTGISMCPQGECVNAKSDSLARSNHDTTLELIKEKSLTLLNIDASTHAVEIVKDVFRLVPVCALVAGRRVSRSRRPLSLVVFAASTKCSRRFIRGHVICFLQHFFSCRIRHHGF